MYDQPLSYTRLKHIYMPTDYFLQMIKTLREEEEVVLYSSIPTTTQDEENAITSFLEEEYLMESLIYPGTLPEFNAKAAIWAAKTIYYTAISILYRDKNSEELLQLFPKYDDSIDTSAMLSADLCLRFLPDMIVQLELIDSNDIMVEYLSKLINQWHYSGIRSSKLDIDTLNFDELVINNLMTRIYADRVIKFNKLQLALHPTLAPIIKGILGNHSSAYWREFETAIKTHE